MALLSKRTPLIAGVSTSEITSRAQGLEIQKCLARSLLEQKWKLMPHDLVNQGPKVPNAKWAPQRQAVARRSDVLCG